MFKSFTLNLTRFIYYVRNPAKKKRLPKWKPLF